MTPFLLTVLLVLDVGLVMMFFMLSRRQSAHGSLLEELTEERRAIEELRQSVQDDLEFTQNKTKEIVERITHLATEAEQEVKSGGQTLAKELESLLTQLPSRFEGPLKELARRQAAVEMLLKRVEVEKQILMRAIQRGEKISQFFDSRIPYEQVLSDIEDKKYADARALLAKGLEPKRIAEELGMTLTEINLVAGISRT